MSAPTIAFAIPNDSRPFRSSALSFQGAKSPQRELSLPWNCRSMEHSLLGIFAPVELSFLGSERSKNFRSYETVLSRERIFQELSLQMS